MKILKIIIVFKQEILNFVSLKNKLPADEQHFGLRYLAELIF